MMELAKVSVCQPMVVDKKSSFLTDRSFTLEIVGGNPLSFRIGKDEREGMVSCLILDFLFELPVLI